MSIVSALWSSFYFQIATVTIISIVASLGILLKLYINDKLTLTFHPIIHYS